MSAVIFGGLPGEIVELAAARWVEFVFSPALIVEFRRVLREKFAFSDAALYLTETLLRRAATIVEPDRPLAVIAEDPFPFMTPRQFLNRLRRSRPGPR